MSTLYIVATPIGNLDDLTLRSADVLRTAPVVVAEDTRVTRKLLERVRSKAKGGQLSQEILGKRCSQSSRLS